MEGGKSGGAQGGHLVGRGWAVSVQKAIRKASEQERLCSMELEEVDRAVVVRGTSI